MVEERRKIINYKYSIGTQPQDRWTKRGMDKMCKFLIYTLDKILETGAEMEGGKNQNKY